VDDLREDIRVAGRQRILEEVSGDDLRSAGRKSGASRSPRPAPISGLSVRLDSKRERLGRMTQSIDGTWPGSTGLTAPSARPRSSRWVQNGYVSPGTGGHARPLPKR
jgi:hypothetical protein